MKARCIAGTIRPNPPRAWGGMLRFLCLHLRMYVVRTPFFARACFDFFITLACIVIHFFRRSLTETLTDASRASVLSLLCCMHVDQRASPGASAQYHKKREQCVDVHGTSTSTRFADKQQQQQQHEPGGLLMQTWYGWQVLWPGGGFADYGREAAGVRDGEQREERHICALQDDSAPF